MKTLCVALLVLTSKLFAQSTPELEIKGYGQIKTQPDIGVISASVTTIQKDFGTTVSILNSNNDMLSTHLEKLGFQREEIKTTDFNVREHTVYKRDISYDSGFVGNQSLVIEFKNTKENIARIIEAFTKSPIDAQFSLHFTVSDELKDKLRDELIKRAISDAKQKAKLIADASSQQLGRIKSIRYGASLYDDFGMYETAGDFNISMDPHQPIQRTLGFDIREITFSDYVVVAYELK